MSEKELPVIVVDRISSKHWDDTEEDYAVDDDFDSENDDAFQSIEDRDLIDPEDDDFEGRVLDF